MQRPKFLTYVLATITGFQDYRLLRAFLLKEKRRLDKNFTSLFSDRLITFVKILIIPLQLRLSRKNPESDELIICFQKNLALRQKYIQQISQKDTAYFANLDISPGSVIKFESLKGLLLILNTYIKFIGIGFLLFFETSRISTKSLAQTAILFSKINGITLPRKTYVFFTYLPDVYLLSLYLAGKKIPSDHMMTNMLYYYDRYSNFFQNQRLCFSSEAFFLEYTYYSEKKWINTKARETIITNNEFLVNNEANKAARNRFDIGYFSSGEWARIKGTHRTDDIDRIRSGKFVNNSRYALVKKVLNVLVDLAGNENFHVKVYLHPYEKNLMATYDIRPDFWELIDGKKNVTIDTSDANSNIFESKVGITLSSAIFFDRWNENLPTFCYESTDLRSFFIPLKYMEKYKEYGYQRVDQLKRKIVKELGRHAEK